MNSRTPRLVVALIAPFLLNAMGWASDTRQGVAELVSEESYRHYLEDLLFTHDGDDRGVTAPDHDQARDNIFDTFAGFGLDVELEEFEFYGLTGYNVVATQWGVIHPEIQYVVGAHYDSAYTPGADDDGSGTAAIMEVARVLSAYPLMYTVKYIAFDAEEWGLFGSSAYVDAHAEEDIRGMIELDMIAYNEGLELGAIYRNPDYSDFAYFVDAAVKEYGDGLDTRVLGEADNSDHAPFDNAGIPAIWLAEYDLDTNPCYHQACDSVDTPDYINYPYALKFIRSVAGALADLALVVVGAPCDGDVNGNGTVDPMDTGFVLARLGCVPDGDDPDCTAADANLDGQVNPLDAGFVMSRFGDCL